MPILITKRLFLIVTGVEVLEEFCQRNNWPMPQYQLHSAVHHDVANNSAVDVQLFIFKVYVVVFRFIFVAVIFDSGQRSAGGN